MRSLALLTLPSLALVLGALEVAFRTVVPASEQPYAAAVSADEIGRFDPGVAREGVATYGVLARERARWRINDAGWNSAVEYRRASERDLPLVGVLGDSYVEGLHVDVDRNVAAELQKRLPERTVYAFAQSGAPLSHHLRLARHAAEYAPEALVSVVVWNDIDQSLVAHHRSRFLQLERGRDGGWLERPPAAYTPDPVRRALSRSALVRYLWLNVKLGGRLGFGAAQELGTRSFDAAELESAVRFIATRLRRDHPNTRLVFVMDAARRSLYAGESPDPDLTRVVAAALRDTGVAFVDLTPRFARHWSEHGQPFNSNVDYHWNALGHRIAAEAIHDWLATSGETSRSR